MARDLLLSLQLPHWLMIAGAVLVVGGCIGFAIRQNRPTQSVIDPVSKQSPEPRKIPTAVAAPP
ncbi:hypothetical protein AAFG13_38605 [Bradyrhizobium sp. B124]|uniref:hypothetical protein n=1 Tax=Bradyrhizobium sp. B124 TaxID=3140245 RepID=UPI00318381B3